MKIVPVHNCDECKYFSSVDKNYSVYCDLQEDSVRYKDYGTQNYHWEESVAELYKTCPLVDIDELLNTPAKVIYEKLYNDDLEAQK